MRRPATAATLAATALAIGLAWTHPWVPEPEPARVYLPHAAQRIAAPKPTARPVYQPRDVESLERALGHAGALVVPRGGVYKLSRPASLAAGVTLDGGGIGRVVVTGHGLRVEADDVTIRGLTVMGVSADAIGVERSQRVLIEDVALYHAGDGELDAIRGVDMVVRNSTIGPGVKCSLIGHQLAPADGLTRVTFENVTFDRCQKRTPKVHRGTVVLRDVTIGHWRQYAVDVQLGGLVIIDGVTWLPGPKSHDRWITRTGGRVEVSDGR